MNLSRIAAFFLIAHAQWAFCAPNFFDDFVGVWQGTVKTRESTLHYESGIVSSTEIYKIDISYTKHPDEAELNYLNVDIFVDGEAQDTLRVKRWPSLWGNLLVMGERAGGFIAGEGEEKKIILSGWQENFITEKGMISANVAYELEFGKDPTLGTPSIFFVKNRHRSEFFDRLDIRSTHFGFWSEGVLTKLP